MQRPYSPNIWLVVLLSCLSAQAAEPAADEILKA
jgi:hypothetical protein